MLSSRRQRLEGLAFHLLLLLSVALAQIVYTPARSLNPDNTWHFRLARDIAQGEPVYWSAVDANRLFPDLLFSLAAFALPGGNAFQAWETYFYVLVAAAITLSLAALSGALFEEARRRRTFVLCASLALFLFMLLLPFWDRWLLDPGNHGTGLPACFLALALILRMNRTGRLAPLWGGLFLVTAGLLVASNRYLLIALMAPLILALLAAWLLGRAGEAGGRGDVRLLALAGLAAAATLAGHLGWHAIGQLSWHRIVQLGGMPDLPKSDHLAWLAKRVETMAAAFRATLTETPDVVAGVGILSLTIPAAAVLIGLARRGGEGAAAAQNRLVLVLLAAASAALSLAFVLISVDLSGAWQFRFIAVPTALAVVALASLLAGLHPLIAGWHLPATALAAAGLLASTWALSARRQPGPVAEEARFARALGVLEARLAARSGAAPGAVMRGFSEYWIANEVTTRSKILRVETLEPHQGLEYRFYNNNAGHLCEGGYFFLLHDGAKDEPRRAGIDAKLGPAVESEPFDLVKYRGTILVYDPALLQERLVEEARRAAPRLFPGFTCAGR